MKTVHVAIAGGCIRSQMDLSRVVSYLRMNGWSVTEDVRSADLMVVCGCGFTNEAEALSLSYLDSLVKQTRPGTRVVALGCLAGIGPSAAFDALGAIPFTRSRLAELDGLILADTPFASVPDANLLEDAVLSGRESISKGAHLKAWASYPKNLPLYVLLALRDTLWGSERRKHAEQGGIFRIRVATGCSSSCTYCAIRLAVGEIRSKPLAQIEDEFEAGLARGFTRFELVGEDIGAYGQDSDSCVADLLEALFSREGDFQIEWGDFGPTWLIRYFPRLLPLMRANADKLRFAAFPIQSGSDRVLQAMGRDYRAADVLECLTSLKREVPGLRLGTHIMVGFPGETKEDFRQTIRFVRSAPFDMVQPYVFSPRTGTVAAGLPDSVGGLTKQARVWAFRIRRRLTKAASA